MVHRVLVFAISWLVFLDWAATAQSLADVARKEREKRAQEKSVKKVYTNDDLDKYESLRTSSTSAPSPTTEAAEAAATASKSPNLSPSDSDERTWSKRFIEAKGKLQQTKAQAEALQAKLNDLNVKLIRQADVYDRENVYGPLIAQTRQQIEQNKAASIAAQQALDDLREELRKSGQPVSWENSEAALKPDPKEPQSSAQPKTKDQKYWQDRASSIDKRYDALIAPLETERFQLVNRRDPKEGESTASPGILGLGAPPRVIDIDVQIKELNKKREQEKQDLVSQAIREGALPGWFR